MPKVIFKIDPLKELEYLSFYESMASYRCTYDKLPREWRIKIWDSGLNIHKNDLIKLIETEWASKNSTGKLRTEIFKDKEVEWKTYEQNYFRFIEEVTGYKWQYSNYTNYGAVFSYPNFYNMRWARPEILTTVNDMDMPALKIAHELFHAHQVTIFTKLFGNDYLDKVSEEFIESMLILVFTENGSPFDLDRKELIDERKEYLDQDIKESIDVLVDFWNIRTDFDSFTLKAVDLIS